MRHLIALLTKYGWELGQHNSEVILFVRKFKHDVFGNLVYTVRIVAHGADIDFREFKSCQLIGPTRNARTGAFNASTVLGEWHSLDGTLGGLLPKFESARLNYISREGKYLARMNRS